MKHHLHNIKVVRYIGIVLFALILVLVSSRAAAATPPDDPSGNTQESRDAIASYLAAQQNPALSDEEKIKAAINTYFTLRYEERKSLVKQDFSLLLADDMLEWAKTEQDKREIELYIATLFDLRYEKYVFTLGYDSIDVKGDEAFIRLRESHTVVFSALAPDESMLYNLSHTITLHYNKGAWAIYQDEYEDELSNLLKHTTVEEIKKAVDENYKNEQQTFVPTIEDVESLSLTNYSYNRTAAVNYANIHSSEYNVGWYATQPGTDCANYVSQSLYAGGWKAPPDTRGMITGSRSWYDDWYYDFYTRTGSAPWVRVEEQKVFITGNTDETDIGPYGYVTTSLCTLDVGDIVQLRNANPDVAEWDHEGIVVWENTAGNCASLSSYWINAHTNDRYHLPLSDPIWSSFYPNNMRFIHITGYRLDTTTPTMPTFSDVSKSHWAWQDIERLYVSGFTAGCATNPLRYCPTNNVTRAEMAIFLLRGIHGSSYMPPPATGTIFADVPTSHWAAKWIEQLYLEGITAGCNTNPLRYCPENSVTHAQMAVFLLRAKYTSAYQPPAWGISYFDDVPIVHWASDWIKQLSSAGFSYGAYNCAAFPYPGAYYCPEQAITRAEMASMLDRTFDLP